MIGRYAEITKVVPLFGCYNIGSSATNSKALDLARCHRATFFVVHGVVTAASPTLQSVVLTVLASSVVTSGTGTAIAFNYRVSGAVATDTWGSPTAALAAGATIMAGTLTGATVSIDVDPAIALNGPASLDGRYIRIVATPGTGVTVDNMAVVAEVEPRYIQTSPESAS